MTPTKRYLLDLAHLLWRRASSRLPVETLMNDEEALLDALRALIPQGTSDACIRELDEAISVETLFSCFDGQLALIGLPRWAQCGFPEVQLPETYAAALLATVATDE